MQGRNKTNQSRTESEDLAEGLDESTDIQQASDDADRTSRAGGRNSDRAGDPQVQAAVRASGSSRDGTNTVRDASTRATNTANARPSTRRIDTIDARANFDDDD